jgi:hypothetical protein
VTFALKMTKTARLFLDALSAVVTRKEGEFVLPGPWRVDGSTDTPNLPAADDADGFQCDDTGEKRFLCSAIFPQATGSDYKLTEVFKSLVDLATVKSIRDWPLDPAPG